MHNILLQKTGEPSIDSHDLNSINIQRTMLILLPICLGERKRHDLERPNAVPAKDDKIEPDPKRLFLGE